MYCHEVGAIRVPTSFATILDCLDQTKDQNYGKQLKTYANTNAYSGVHKD